MDRIFKAIPEIAAERKQHAAKWRASRAKSPAITRLLFKRIKKAENEVILAIFSEGTSPNSPLTKLFS